MHKYVSMPTNNLSKEEFLMTVTKNKSEFIELDSNELDDIDGGSVRGVLGAIGGAITGGLSGAFQGAKTGANLGSTLGPKGAVIGGAVGFVGGGLIGAAIFW